MSPRYPVTRTQAPTSDAELSKILASPEFGRHFADHMASATWTPDDGWHDRGVGPIKPFSLHPGTAVLHYAQEIFEGLKAYRHADGGIHLFRPELNAKRFARSAERLALPRLPEEEFIASVEELVRVDARWVPIPEVEKSLYVRPFMFAIDEYLAAKPAEVVAYSVIAWPTGSLFAAGQSGVTLWVSSRYTRSALGGTGGAKCGGNYAAGMAAQIEAKQHGCDQVMYLDRTGGEGYLEESGTMNLCLVTSDGDLITPALGTILEGVTRDTILTLAADFGLTVVERPIPLEELRRGAADGRITEAFATGTAAAITPVVGFKGDGYEFTVGTGKPGEQTTALRAELLDIQYGRVEDRRGWLRRVL
ncbi:branched-chain amino acid aminotransferase [Micromonospora sp. WMMA1363]|uniref:branched-chain amino acid aminotransferase n=1 Tax=Micromonospora sp. WMMA1363 TaxID=3053985 RepID=UPI00259D1E21|nr:branched-chain amino acid aminotransferase [Micromonospora sp. WMMA1363]MDM4719711.1 branched-chain amino acid aminotransferase [Micromonospora sp. WMMA1363]